jgi:phospholipase/carboxylesterase
MEDLFSFANELPDAYYVISAKHMTSNTVAMPGMPSILMQIKINFQIMNRPNLRDLIAGFIDELYPQLSIDPKAVSLLASAKVPY